MRAFDVGVVHQGVGAIRKDVGVMRSKPLGCIMVLEARGRAVKKEHSAAQLAVRMRVGANGAELGMFVGVRERGRLLAMAGERMWIGDHREVSAVCTHPEAQGRGFARVLVARVVNEMLRLGQTPFLHVESGNARAIRTYEGLGFVKRREFPLLYARRMQ
jgi:predicted GNAT family acetyltransferase